MGAYLSYTSQEPEIKDDFKELIIPEEPKVVPPMIKVSEESLERFKQSLRDRKKTEDKNIVGTYEHYRENKERINKKTEKHARIRNCIEEKKKEELGITFFDEIKMLKDVKLKRVNSEKPKIPKRDVLSRKFQEEIIMCIRTIRKEDTIFVDEFESL